MTWLICDYIASYRDKHITAEQFREAMTDPDVISQQELADFILESFDRNFLGGIPPMGYYDRVTSRVRVPISWK